MTSNRKPATGYRTSESGVSLVEVMIAMLLGLLLLAGIMQVFSSSRQTYRVHEAVSRMQENGRMALEVISRDIRMADFWGCSGNISNVVNNLDSAQSGFIDFDLGGVGGTNSAGAAPDTLILRGGINSGLSITPPYGPEPSASIGVAPNSGLQQGDIVFISDCTNGDVFQVTNANPNGSGQLVHNTGLAVAPGNSNVTNPGCPGANAHCLSKVYGGDATVFSAQQIIYTIAPGSEGQPALFRNGLEFIDGIEDFQVLFGEDTDAPGTAGFAIANYYVPADQVVNMNNVVSIRFAVVMRSYEDNLSGNVAQNYTVLGTNMVSGDNRLRQVYTSTVAIRNRI